MMVFFQLSFVSLDTACLRWRLPCLWTGVLRSCVVSEGQGLSRSSGTFGGHRALLETSSHSPHDPEVLLCIPCWLAG